MQTMLILSVLAPAVFAGGLLAVGYGVWRSAPGQPGRWSLAFAPALGAFAAYFFVRGFPGLPPADASVWPLWLALVAAAVATFVGLTAPLGWVAPVLVAAASSALVVQPLFGTWSAVGIGAWVILPTAAVTATWLALDARAQSLPGPGVPVILAGLSLGTAVVLGLSGTALLAQATAGLGVANGVIVLLAAWQPSLRGTGAAVGATSVMLGGCLVAGVHYAETGWVSVVVLLAGALVAGLAPLPASARSPWRAAIALGLVTAITSGSAIGVTALTEDAEAAFDEAGDDDAYDF